MPLPLTHDDPHDLGPFRLVARLGSGGMGTVYLARSAGGRTVALKTMHARIASEATFRTRFRLESDAARVIGGRYGAQVVAADPLAATPWLATAYVLGPPLDDAVEQTGPLPEASVRALGAALCEALGRLHRSDVVHRDLKPSNIMITAYGPKVIDFGIARAAGAERLTHTGSAVGTPAFMSPEQAAGEEHTPAGDVFALAGVLVFAATGHGPFGDGRPADLLYRVRYSAPDLTGVPAALVPALTHALARNPAERPGIEELLARLHDGSGQFADHLPDGVLAMIGARASEVWRVTPRRLPAPSDEPAASEQAPVATGPSRRGLLVAGAGSALGLAGIGAGARAWLGPQDPSPTPPAYREPKPGPSVGAPPRRKLDSLWQIQLGGNDEGESPAVPLVVDGVVILAPGMKTYGIDGRSGAVDWSSTAADIWHLASDGRRAYRIVNFRHPSRSTYAVAPLDTATGKTGRPETDLTDSRGRLLAVQLLGVSGGTAYLAVCQRDTVKRYEREMPWNVTAVDLATGRKRWYEPVPFHPTDSDDLHFLTATVAGGRLVALQRMNDGTVRIVARDTRTGKVAWDRPLAGAKPEAVTYPLTADGKHLYLGVGRLRALRLGDGKQVWEAAGTYGPPALKDGVLYVVQEGTGLAAVTASGGERRWNQRDAHGARTALTALPVIGSRYAYTHSRKDGVLRAVGLTSHTTAKQYRTTGNRFVADEHNKVIIASDAHFLAAFPLQ
ncbi:protein kinase [Streptomyces sp. NPDC048650]|uniref:serine/threonine-protein kinase n=1 Tax=Streptomyces sp. NPDC048650 TaxID=3365583 RepID=UPI0037101066